MYIKKINPLICTTIEKKPFMAQGKTLPFIFKSFDLVKKTLKQQQISSYLYQ